MRIFFVGLLVGVALTALASYAMWPPHVSDVPAAIEASRGVPMTAPPSRLAVPASSSSTTSAERPRPTSPTAPAIAATSAATVTGTAAPMPVPGAGPVPAVTLSAEHAAVLVGKRRPPTLQEQHADFASQPKDPVDSARLEDAIRQAVAAANGSGEFELMTVDCRMSLCEVLAFGNLPSSGEKWNETFGAMSKASWFSEAFRGDSTSSAANNNRYTIVTILQRKK